MTSGREWLRSAGTIGAVRARWPWWCLGLASTARLVQVVLQPALRARQIDIAVYLLGAQHLFGHDLYSIRTTGVVLPFLYSPFAGFLFVPLAHLPWRASQVTWALVNAAAIVGLVFVSLRAARPSMSRRDAACWAMVLSWPAYLLEPVRLTVDYGQVNIVLAVAVLADLTTTRRVGRRSLPEGVLTGLAAAVKLTPLIFVPFLWLVGRRRGAVTALVTFAACGLAMFVVAPSSSWAFWTDYAYKANRVGVVYISDQNVQSMVMRLRHAPVLGVGGALVVAAVGVGGIALAVWAYRSSSAFLGVLVCACTGLLVSPITWSHHMVWVVPVIAWLALAEDRPRFGRLWAVLAAWLFWKAPIWWAPHDQNRELHFHGTQYIVGDSFFLATAALLVGVALMLTLRRRSRGEAGTPHGQHGQGGHEQGREADDGCDPATGQACSHDAEQREAAN